jgi:hypothetical protein
MVGSRTMDAGFFWHWSPLSWIRGADCNVKQASNALRVSNGNRTVHASIISLLYVELGLLFQPLQEQCVKYGYLVTHSWIKTHWEKLPMFDMHVVVADQPQEFPWEGDQFIMQALIRTGYTSKALGCPNRVQVSLQLLFMSDILAASGMCRHPLALAAWRSMVKDEIA